ncbi:MAG: hypothetical protein ABSH34_15635 [Verrucomicrobiota bacterium]|jgi:hypothetical protein
MSPGDFTKAIVLWFKFGAAIARDALADFCFWSSKKLLRFIKQKTDSISRLWFGIKASMCLSSHVLLPAVANGGPA